MSSRKNRHDELLFSINLAKPILWQLYFGSPRNKAYGRTFDQFFQHHGFARIAFPAVVDYGQLPPQVSIFVGDRDQTASGEFGQSRHSAFGVLHCSLCEVGAVVSGFGLSHLAAEYCNCVQPAKVILHFAL